MSRPTARGANAELNASVRSSCGMKPSRTISGARSDPRSRSPRARTAGGSSRRSRRARRPSPSSGTTTSVGHDRRADALEAHDAEAALPFVARELGRELLRPDGANERAECVVGVGVVRLAPRDRDEVAALGHRDVLLARVLPRRALVAKRDHRRVGEAERPDRELRGDEPLEKRGERRSVRAAHESDRERLLLHHANRDLADDAGDALGAVDEIEIVALERPDLAGGKDETRRDDVVAEPAVLVRAVAGAALREPSADARRRVRARVEAEGEPARAERGVELLEDDARLHRRRQRGFVDRDRAVHAPEIDDEAAARRNDAAVTRRRLRARRERNAVLARPAHQRDELALALGLDDRVGDAVAGERAHAFGQRAHVVAVEAALGRLEADASLESLLEIGAAIGGEVVHAGRAAFAVPAETAASSPALRAAGRIRCGDARALRRPRRSSRDLRRCRRLPSGPGGASARGCGRSSRRRPPRGRRRCRRAARRSSRRSRRRRNACTRCRSRCIPG